MDNAFRRRCFSYINDFNCFICSTNGPNKRVIKRKNVPHFKEKTLHKCYKFLTISNNYCYLSPIYISQTM